MVRLDGDAWSLGDLAEWFAKSKYLVEVKDNQYFLTAPQLAGCSSDDEAWDCAEKIVDRINAAANAVNLELRAVRVGAVVWLQEDGKRRSSVRLCGSISVARARGFRGFLNVGKSDQPDEPATQSQAERFVDLIAQEGDEGAVTRALSYWRAGKEPSSLFNIAEVIRDDVSAKPAGKGNWNQMAVKLAPVLNISVAELSER